MGWDGQGKRPRGHSKGQRRGGGRAAGLLIWTVRSGSKAHKRSQGGPRSRKEAPRAPREPQQRRTPTSPQHGGSPAPLTDSEFRETAAAPPRQTAGGRARGPHGTGPDRTRQRRENRLLPPLPAPAASFFHLLLPPPQTKWRKPRPGAGLGLLLANGRTELSLSANGKEEPSLWANGSGALPLSANGNAALACCWLWLRRRGRGRVVVAESLKCSRRGARREQSFAGCVFAAVLGRPQRPHAAMGRCRVDARRKRRRAFLDLAAGWICLAWLRLFVTKTLFVFSFPPRELGGGGEGGEEWRKKVVVMLPAHPLKKEKTDIEAVFNAQKSSTRQSLEHGHLRGMCKIWSQKTGTAIPAVLLTTCVMLHKSLHFF
ncbi:uncharacterized protein LOC110206005 [Phascolarctos cinereus]